MINIEIEYLQLMREILNKGKDKEDRTGTGTKSVFGRMIEHDMSLGFPLLTTKSVYFKAALTEVLWILQGRTDIKYLNDNGVKYWNPDYERSGRTDGTLGPVYGKQWRDFGGHDQLQILLKGIKLDPYGRRHMISAWNPIEMDDMALPPCHYGFQVYINDGQLDLMWNQRSADVFLGLPYDIAMYGLLLELLAKTFGYKPGKLIGSLGDCHLYNNHLEQAKEQLSRKLSILPKIKIDKSITLTGFDNQYVGIPDIKDIQLIDYNPAPAIKAPLSVGVGH
jgi:thymidylate synthase